MLFFKDPMSSDEPYKGWQTADEYLSGNVRDKLRIAKKEARIDSRYNINVEALEKKHSRRIWMRLKLSVRLGATWIDRDYIQDFMEETLIRHIICVERLK